MSSKKIWNRILILRSQNTHWEELLQSVSDFIFSKHCGYRYRGLNGVKRSDFLWEMQKYSLPGRPSSQNWVKSKKHQEMHQYSSNTGKWFLILLNLAGWLTWQLVFLNFSQNFWSFDTPDIPGSESAVFAEIEIWNRLKQFLPVCLRKFVMEEWLAGGWQATPSITKFLNLPSITARWVSASAFHKIEVCFLLLYKLRQSSDIWYLKRTPIYST